MKAAQALAQIWTQYLSCFQKPHKTNEHFRAGWRDEHSLMMKVGEEWWAWKTLKSGNVITLTATDRLNILYRIIIFMYYPLVFRGRTSECA